MNIPKLFYIMKMQIFVDLVGIFFNFDPVWGRVGVGGFQSLVWQGKKLIGARERLSLADYQKSLISTTTLHTARW